MREGSEEHKSAQMMYSKVLLTILQTLAPILPLTTQEAYEHIKATNASLIGRESLPDYSSMPETVYQLKWPKYSDLNIDPKFLSKYETFDVVD